MGNHLIILLSLQYMKSSVLALIASAACAISLGNQTHREENCGKAGNMRYEITCKNRGNYLGACDKLKPCVRTITSYRKPTTITSVKPTTITSYRKPTTYRTSQPAMRELDTITRRMP